MLRHSPAPAAPAAPAATRVAVLMLDVLETAGSPVSITLEDGGASFPHGGGRVHAKPCPSSGGTCLWWLRPDHTIFATGYAYSECELLDILTNWLHS